MNDVSLPLPLRLRAAARHRARTAALVRTFGDVSLADACRRLDELGETTFTGRRFTRHYLSMLLRAERAKEDPNHAHE